MIETTWLQMALIAGLSGVLLWSAIEDIRKREIPNTAVVSVLILYCIYSIAGFSDWQNGLIAAVVIFIPTFLLFQFGVFGGGDAKMMTVVAPFMGLKALSLFLLIVAVAGALLALGMALHGIWSRRRQSRETIIEEVRTLSIPYGVAIAAGGMLPILSLIHSRGF